MAVDLQEMKSNLELILQHFRANDHFVEQNFISKYNLKVPFDTLENFNNFDSLLSSDKEEMKRDFVSFV